MYVHASMKISMMALGFRIKIPKPFHILISILISLLSSPMLKWWGKINHFAKFVYNEGVTEGTFSTYKSCIHPAIAHATLMQHVVTLWVAVQVSRQFLHVKHFFLLRKRLITMYVVVLVEENENREFHWWKIWPPHLHVRVTTRIVWLKSRTLGTPLTVSRFSVWSLRSSTYCHGRPYCF